MWMYDYHENGLITGKVILYKPALSILNHKKVRIKIHFYQ